ncbi:MAG: helix-turn-helix domain-containing protein [Chloroflexi bacterium]|nr:helix-turn-helix domain-containing protein [Chloroflexota bacterium]
MPLVTVSELLRFALPGRATVLAGAAGLHQPVSWARLLRARPANLGRIESGEVWLLSSGALQLLGDARAVGRMIRDMGEAGVVAFITADPQPHEVCAEAEEVGTPLIQVPAEASLAEVEKTIVGFVVDRDRAIGQRAQEVYERLLATLVEDRGPELIAQIVAEVTGKAVYLLDEHFQPTVQTGGDSGTAEALADVRRRHWEGLLGSVSERLISVRSAEEPLGVALRPLTLRGAVEGYLALLGPPDDFVDFDHQVADRAASVLAIELAKQSAVVEARLRLQGDFLSDLLDTPAQPDDVLVDKARRLGYDLTRPHLVFVLRPRETAHDLSNGTSNPMLVRNYQRLVDAARRRLVLADPATLLREHDGTIQVLMPCPSELAADEPDAITGWVEELRVSLEEALRPETHPVVAGIGRTPSAETTPYAAIREAARAADIAATMAQDGSPSALHFARLGALRLIFHLADNPELRAFQRDVLGPLEASDAARRSEFVRTLQAFLHAGGNHMRAARDLNVHRNTLIYRLERIQELLGGASLEDPEMRLNLQLALKIRAALGAASPDREVHQKRGTS